MPMMREDVELYFEEIPVTKLDFAPHVHRSSYAVDIRT
jgi:hypothetical protein